MKTLQNDSHRIRVILMFITTIALTASSLSASTLLWAAPSVSENTLQTAEKKTAQTADDDRVDDSFVNADPNETDPGHTEVSDAETSDADTLLSPEVTYDAATLARLENVKAFVGRMYTVALNRTAEESGLYYWVALLMDKKADGATLARGFIFSAEFEARNLSNEDYLNVLYATFFDRAADADGFAYWIGKLNGGTPRSQILSGFVNSAEFSNLCARFGIARGTMEDDASSIYNDGVYAFTERMYTKALNRSGDTEGIEYWAHRINTGAISAFECAWGFFHSVEFTNRNLADEAFVEVVYQTFFDREADADGKAYWLSKLQSGASRDDVLYGFRDSAEFQRLLTKYGFYSMDSVSESLPCNQPFATGTCGSNYFRIPSIVSLDDGTLIASADARWNARFDAGGVDTCVAVSTDMGMTWNSSLVNYFGDNGNVYNQNSTTFMDSSLATDGKNVFMLTNLFPAGYSFWETTNKFPLGGTGFDAYGRLKLRSKRTGAYDYYLQDGKIYQSNGQMVNGYTVDKNFYLNRSGLVSNLFYVAGADYAVYPTEYLSLKISTDSGKSWTAPSLLNIKLTTEQGYGVSAGNGLVFSDGSVLFPCYSTTEDKGSASLAYSNNGGGTWRRSGDVSTDQRTSESAIIRLSDNKIRMFLRDAFSELYYCDFTRSSGTWTKSGSGTVKGVTVAKNCQISALSYDDDTILICAPSTGTDDRKSGMISTLKLESGDNMRLSHQCAVNGDAYFGYSSMARLSDGSVGLLYESKVEDGGCNVSFMRISSDHVGIINN
ncbi:MAG: DUF4214 domain-containing protein [Lachnospiraceae bacterium]|nr:DUF4214 domain-containing protein [Lachnospiraceae bacterium]